MHILHKILVRLEPSNDSKEQLIRNARRTAENATSDFGDDVYDWRETDTAGRWGSEYAPNVLFAKDNLDRVLKEIEETETMQRSTMLHYRDQVKTRGATIDDLFDTLYEHPACAWELKQLAKLLYGEYDFDSGFFDAEDYTARIDKYTYQKIKKNPSAWALVMFDYHS